MSGLGALVSGGLSQRISLCNQNLRQLIMAKKERRKANRIKKEDRVTITPVSQFEAQQRKKFFYILSKDISLTGIKIQTDTFFPVGPLLKIEISLTNPPRSISANGRVRQVKTLSARELFEIGCEFVEMSIHDTRIFKDYIKKLKAQSFTSFMNYDRSPSER